MKKKTALIILYFILAAIVLTFVAHIIIAKTIKPTFIVKILVSLAICVSAIVKVSTGTGGKKCNTSLYEDKYQEALTGAFTGEDCKQEHKQLMDAIGLYDQNQYEPALKKLKNLMQYCRTDDDCCAVLIFMALIYTNIGLPNSAINAYYELLHHDRTRSSMVKSWASVQAAGKKQGRALMLCECLEI